MKKLSLVLVMAAAFMLILFLPSIGEASKEFYVFEKLGGFKGPFTAIMGPEKLKYLVEPDGTVIDANGNVVIAGKSSKKECVSKKTKKVRPEKTRAKVIETVAPKVSMVKAPSPFGGYKGDYVKIKRICDEGKRASNPCDRPEQKVEKSHFTCKAAVKPAKIRKHRKVKKISTKIELQKRIIIPLEAADKKASLEVPKMKTLKDRIPRQIEAKNQKYPKSENKVVSKATEKIKVKPVNRDDNKVDEFWFRLSQKTSDGSVKTFVRVIAPGKEEHRHPEDASRWSVQDMPTWARILQIGGNEPHPVIMQISDSEVPAGKVITGWENKFQRSW